MHTIRNKIISSVIFIVILSLTTISLLAYERFSMILEEQALAENSIHLEQAALQVNQLIDDVYKYAGNMVNDGLLQDFANRTSYPSVFEELEAYSDVVTQLTKFNVLRDYLESSAIIRSDGKVYWSSLYTDPYYKELLQEDWYQSKIQTEAKSGFTIPHDILNPGPKKVVSFFIRFDPQYGGVLVLNIDYAVFMDMFNYLETNFDQYAWVEKDGTVWHNHGIPAERLIQATASLHPGMSKDTGSDGYYLTNHFEKTNWSLVAFTSKDRFYELVGYVLRYWVVFVLLCLILCILIFYPIVTNITRPISQMTRAMKMVSMGNYNVSLTFKSKDELSILKQGFEKMIDEIQKQIEEKVEQERWKRQMSTELLFAQINPHFIYNTLNTVVYMARKAKHKPIEEMMESFIGVLHDAVKLGEEGFYTTVRNEIVIIDHYVRIQRYRYADSFSLVWRVEEETQDCMVPKSLLQPLVENAIFHGFADIDKTGQIQIIIRLAGGRLMLCVSDNGSGMDDQLQLKNIHGEPLARDKGPGGLKPIGLANIRERIKYLYGDEGSMSISSVLGEGFTVTIEIPAKLENIR
ncbi:sensor histidine kinase [Paenibacillus luteus]|uniref:sensor histidine kinase n=1 Tax=Paenibacillus luteus TaxID=2545753 RepID=UPI001144FCE3|nr:sensor histidine kinase [Paenibacillus luteus]